MFQDALALISILLTELKRLDDKMALLEVQLLESRVYFAIKNLAKSKAALTAARTVANSVYCPPLIQAGLDMQSGFIHAEERDFKTAYSYFFEALDAFTSQEDSRALSTLKYMLLCKIMLNQVSSQIMKADEVHNIILNKLAVNHSSNRHILAMVDVAKAYQSRSLKALEKTLHDFNEGLKES